MLGGSWSTTADDERSDWHLQGAQLDLIITPEGEAAPIALGDDVAIDGFDQLCSVRGRVSTNGVEHELDCLGRRGVRAGELASGGIDSVREVAAWFGDDEGLAIIAVRRERAAGHDKDAVSGVLFETGLFIPVANPRLSTTYAASGEPARAGLELWLGDEDDEDNEAPYPRRAAGEAAGGGVSLSDPQLDVRVEPFRWHMGGREGLGVYQLLRPR
jgi:hypothetical protein